MNEVDQWIYFDGPEPEHLRPLLDALRELPPSTAEDAQRCARFFFEALQKQKTQQGSPASTEERRSEHVAAESLPSSPTGRVVSEGGPTARSPDPAPAPSTDEPPPKNEPVRVAWPAGQAADEPAFAKLPELMSTSNAVEIPDELRPSPLPFVPPSPAQPRAAKTVQVPVKNLKFGNTLDIEQSFEVARAALPFLTNTVGEGIVPFPRLTLVQYASFRAELAVWPGSSSEILSKYLVLHEASRAALDEHWRKYLAERPAERATFEQKLGEYTAYLREVGRPPGPAAR